MSWLKLLVLMWLSDLSGSAATLQSQIDAANPGDSIQIPAGTYLESLVIGKDLNLIGEAATNTFLNGQGLQRCVQVLSNATVRIENLTITNGSYHALPQHLGMGGGGGIANFGNLSLSNVVLVGNNGDGDHLGFPGGAIRSWNTLSATNCLITNNVSWTVGGIVSEGPVLNLVGTTISSNSAERACAGVWIGTNTTAYIDSCIINSNRTQVNGGGAEAAGLCNYGNCFIKNTQVNGNTGYVSDDSGGGMLNSGMLVATNCWFDVNNGQNGAVYNNGQIQLLACSLSRTRFGHGFLNSRSGVALLTDCLIQKNERIAYAGGVVNDTGQVQMARCNISDNRSYSAVGAFGYAGGIDNRGSMQILDSTIATNRAAGTGGILNSGVLLLEGSTLVGNFTDDATPPLGVGALHNLASGNVTVRNATICANQAAGSTAAIGAIRNAGGACAIVYSTIASNAAYAIPSSTGFVAPGLFNTNGTFTLQNVIAAGNLSLIKNVYDDASGSFALLGNNLIQATNRALLSGSTTGSIHNQDPKLSPLGNNGGYTRTMALLPSSPAIDSGTLAPGISFDQRGLSRVADGDNDCAAGPDIGAVEVEDASQPHNLIIDLIQNGQVLVQVWSKPGSVCRIESCSSLSAKDWSEVATGTANTKGHFSWQGSLAAGGRFYRAVKVCQ